MRKQKNIFEPFTTLRVLCNRKRLYIKGYGLLLNSLTYILCMKYILLLLALHIVFVPVFGQETEGNFLKDKKTGCTVWLKQTFDEDSATWSGGCKNNLASGKGTMIGFTNGKETYRYIGEMNEGKPNGRGTFTFRGNRKLEGNFRNGEPLFLSNDLLSRLERTVVSETDPTNVYVSDNNQKKLYYDAIIPKGEIRGVIVLIPGTWSTTEYLFSSMNTFCRVAYKNHLAVLALSVNQRLTLTPETLNIINTMLGNAIQSTYINRIKSMRLVTPATQFKRHSYDTSHYR